MRAAVFDLFETLITEFNPQWRSVETTPRRLGIDDAIFEAEWRRHRTARMTLRLDFRDVLRDICAAAGPPGDAALIEQLHAERVASKAATLTRVDPQILESLSLLRKNGWRIGLISNCAIEEVAGWQGSPLAELFDDVVFSYEVGYVKPDPAIYRLACRRLRVAPENAAFIGDGGSDELRGAARVGMMPYCARWFLDQWPDRRETEFPQLANPANIVGALIEGLRQPLPADAHSAVPHGDPPIAGPVE